MMGTGHVFKIPNAKQKGSKLEMVFKPRDASHAARVRKQLKTIKVARHQRRGT